MKMVQQQWESYKFKGAQREWSHEQDAGQDIYTMATSEGSHIRVMAHT
ncbi:hypothetical protein PI124_g19473 [Phytophthora idaei]|nr:hypothetical protein PI125_g24795 [Phytophthora idaei]KAG3125419.1 hypothetical protein PI126_g22774 [Phytophthora idaei]KAG3235495.1 hypothetical protein PI124_g19473 [Phytophthora idaei]